jgi:hypothetical protein
MARRKSEVIRLSLWSRSKTARYLARNFLLMPQKGRRKFRKMRPDAFDSVNVGLADAVTTSVTGPFTSLETASLIGSSRLLQVIIAVPYVGVDDCFVLSETGEKRFDSLLHIVLRPSRAGFDHWLAPRSP